MPDSQALLMKPKGPPIRQVGFVLNVSSSDRLVTHVA
jgi:hypothetical protein